MTTQTTDESQHGYTWEHPLPKGDIPMKAGHTQAYEKLTDLGAGCPFAIGFLVTGTDEVQDGLRDPELFSSARGFDTLESPFQLIPIAADPPDHARYRRILDPFFGPNHIREIEPQLRERVRGLIDAFVDQGHCDAHAELAVPFPTQTFLTLFGFPLEDLDQMLFWKDAVLANSDPERESTPEEQAAPGELFAYVSKYVEERRHGDGDDLMTRLLAVHDDGNLTDPELIGLCFLFVIAGLETVTSAIGLILRRLALRPDLQQWIVADPSVIPNAVEELLRYEHPVWFVPRVATADVEIGDWEVPEGERVNFVVGALSRSPELYDNPDEIDFDREAARTYAFGAGIHRCLGSHLARLELRLVLEEWHARIPSYRVAEGANPQVEWPAQLIGLIHLPLEWDT